MLVEHLLLTQFRRWKSIQVTKVTSVRFVNFSSKCNVVQQKSLHAGAKRFKNEIYEKLFAEGGCRNRHRKAVNSVRNSFKCDVSILFAAKLKGPRESCP